MNPQTGNDQNVIVIAQHNCRTKLTYGCTIEFHCLVAHLHVTVTEVNRTVQGSFGRIIQLLRERNERDNLQQEKEKIASTVCRFSQKSTHFMICMQYTWSTKKGMDIESILNYATIQNKLTQEHSPLHVQTAAWQWSGCSPSCPCQAQRQHTAHSEYRPQEENAMNDLTLATMQQRAKHVYSVL